MSRAFHNRRNILCDKQKKKIFIKSYVWNTLAYEHESWRLRKFEKDRLESVKWKSREKWRESEKKNNKISKEVGDKRILVDFILRIKVKMIEHI